MLVEGHIRRPTTRRVRGRQDRFTVAVHTALLVAARRAALVPAQVVLVLDAAGVDVQRPRAMLQDILGDRPGGQGFTGHHDDFGGGLKCSPEPWRHTRSPASVAPCHMLVRCRIVSRTVNVLSAGRRSMEHLASSG